MILHDVDQWNSYRFRPYFAIEIRIKKPYGGGPLSFKSLLPV
jgi:hypothetical protein